MGKDQPLAVIADDYGPPESFSLRQYDPGDLAQGQVRVRVKAAGLSFVDVLTAAGKYQHRPALPFVPGSEIAGVVEAVGPGGDVAMIGQKVVAVSANGALAHIVNVDQGRCWPMPDDMDFATGATFRVGFITAYEGLVRLGYLQPGETLVVLGASGAVGLAAVQLGSILGARVIASCSTLKKREFAAVHGAQATVASDDPDWRERVRKAAGGAPVDIVVDPVGGAMTELAYRSLAWGGRLMVVGFASGEIAKLPTNLSILKGTSLIGVNVGRLLAEAPATYAANLDALFSLYRTRKLAPIIALQAPLRDFAKAMNAAGGGQTLGRVVVTMD